MVQLVQTFGLTPSQSLVWNWPAGQAVQPWHTVSEVAVQRCCTKPVVPHVEQTAQTVSLLLVGGTSANWFAAHVATATQSPLRTRWNVPVGHCVALHCRSEVDVGGATWGKPRRQKLAVVQRSWFVVLEKDSGAQLAHWRCTDSVASNSTN